MSISRIMYNVASLADELRWIVQIETYLRVYYTQEYLNLFHEVLDAILNPG